MLACGKHYLISLWDPLFYMQCLESISQNDQYLFQQFLEKAPGQNWEKMIDFTSKLGEINDIEDYKGSKILSSKSS